MRASCTPPTLYEDTGDGKAAAIKSQAPLFDASNMVSEQFWVKSNDGVSVPYFLIHRKDVKAPVPTILYSYGGFELSLNPWYWNDGHRPLDAGQVWLSKGGAIAVANIRGGGEFGPGLASGGAEDKPPEGVRRFRFRGEGPGDARLHRRQSTSASSARSNGGVLTTVTMTQHPELLNAVVCQRAAGRHAALHAFRRGRVVGGGIWRSRQAGRPRLYREIFGLPEREAGREISAASSSSPRPATTA